MTEYFFILGRVPALARAELVSVFRSYDVRFQIFAADHSVLLLASPLSPATMINLAQRLGGTVKMGVIIEKLNQRGLSSSHNSDRFFSLFMNILDPRSLQTKILFGFSVYPLKSQPGENLQRVLHEVSMKIKKELKMRGISSRLVGSRRIALSSVIVGENHLLSRGAEFCFFPTPSQIMLGKTLFIQDYRSFSERDYGRPSRDPRSGMLPPKLARMLVNLAAVHPEDILLDPFCGSGTVIQETLLLGIKTVIGSDVDAKTVEATRQNLEWLKKRYPISSSQEPQLLTSSIQGLAKKLKQRVDVIVTEPYLGPPIIGKESRDRLQGILKKLSKLYLDSFRVFRELLKPQGKAVVVFPIIRGRGERLTLNILPSIERLGFCLCHLPDTAFRNPLIYSRPDQRVHREIFMFSLSKEG